jgi:hypothetical protein
MFPSALLLLLILRASDIKFRDADRHSKRALARFRSYGLLDVIGPIERICAKRAQRRKLHNAESSNRRSLVDHRRRRSASRLSANINETANGANGRIISEQWKTFRGEGILVKYAPDNTQSKQHPLSEYLRGGRRGRGGGGVTARGLLHLDVPTLSIATNF